MAGTDASKTTKAPSSPLEAERSRRHPPPERIRCLLDILSALVQNVSIASYRGPGGLRVGQDIPKGEVMLGPSRATAEEAALLAATEVVRGLLAETARGEVLGRHKAGTFLREVKGAPGAYGERCIERIGAELGISAATLYRYVAVAEIWSTGEIQAENTKIDKFGHPLSWSHFVALSQIPDRDIRQRLLAESLKHGWSARDLKIHIAGASQPRPSTEPVDPVEVALREGIHRATQATVDLTIFGEAFADRLQSSATHVHGELVTRAIDAFASLLIRTELTLAQLSHASGASDARVRVAPAVDVARRREHEEQQGDDSCGARPSSGRRIRLG